MKLRHYYAPDLRSALKQARAAQGPDVVIVSRQRTPGGVELVTADELTGVQPAEPHTDGPPAADTAPISECGPTPGTAGTCETGERGTLDRRAGAGEPAAMAGAAASAAADGLDAPGQRLRAVLEPVAAVEPAATPEWLPDAALEGRTSPPENAADRLASELRRLRQLVEGELAGLAWGDFGRRQPLHAALLRRLVAIGLQPATARRIVQAVPSDSDFEAGWSRALGALARALPVCAADVTGEPGVMALFGPTGSGKTTLVAKLAARAALEYGPEQVALVSVDNCRLGAFDQMRGVGRLLGLPVWTARDALELAAVLEGASERHLVLIDTAGLGPRSGHLQAQLEMLGSMAGRVRGYLALSATTEPCGIDQLLAAYDRARPVGCMLTKLDEAGSLGGVLSAVIEQALPVAFISDGQGIPDDLQLPQAHRLVARAVRLGHESARHFDDTLLENAMNEEPARAYA